MATAIYNELCDLDFMDYSEHRAADIDFIQALIDDIGEDETRAFLKAYFE